MEILFMDGKLRVTLEVITPEVAKEYLKANVSNRRLRTNDVRKYVKFQHNGEFKFNPADNIVFDKYGRLINGQHRLTAVVNSGVEMTCLVVRGAEAEAYQIIDCGAVRNISDLYSFEGIPNAPRISRIVNKYFLLKRGLTVTYCAAPGQRGTKFIPREEFLKEYHSDEDFYQRIATLSEFLHKKMRILTDADIGGTYIFLVKAKKHNEEKVRQFFNEVCIPDLSKDTAPTQLYNILRNDKFDKGRRLKAERKRSIVAAAWNAFLLQKRLPANIVKSDNIVRFL